MGPDTKEYYELQSDIWFNECCKRMKERDAYKKQRDELINDMAEVKRKAEAFDEIEQAYFDNDSYSDEQFMELIEETIEEVVSDLEANHEG